MRHRNSTYGSKSQAYALSVLRVAVGAVFTAHGAQKLLVYGLAGTAGAFSQIGIPLPTLSAAAATAAELLGGIALVLGLFTRLATLPLLGTMLVALVAVHAKNGFFLPEGGEYVLTLLAALVTIRLAGPGALALDNLMARRGRGREAPASLTPPITSAARP